MSKIKVKDFLKSITAEKGMSLQDLSKKTGKTVQNISVTISYGKMSMNTFFQFMEALEEDVTLILSNGNKYTLDLEPKEKQVTNK